MRRPVAVLVLAASVVGATPGCRQIAGIHGRAPAQDACAACEREACAAAVTACRGSSPCRERLACSDACDLGDARCVAACEHGFPSAGDAFADVEACRAGACVEACDLRCGGIAITTAEPSAAACDACVAAGCCAASVTCANDAECTRILECVPQSPAADATSSCIEFLHPAGKAAYDGLASCRETRCAEECDVGRSWACVGHVAARVPTTDRVETDIYVVDAAQQSAPVAGLVVRACFLTDVDCSGSTVPTVTTDGDGLARLDVPTTTQGGRPGFIGFLEIQDPAARYMAALAFPGTPVTEPRSARRIIAATPGTVRSFFDLLGVTPDPERGIVISTVTDCIGNNGRGVVVRTDATDPAVRVFYLRFGLPSASAKETDSGGSVVIVPVAPGPLTLTAYDAETDQALGSVRLFVRANTISLAPISPAPFTN